MPILKKSEIEELVDSDGGVISGDRNATNDSEIETGPTTKAFNDTSDYEKGVSTTTDRASRYAQSIPWFASYYAASGPRSLAMRESKTKLTKEDLERSLEEDLVKKSKRELDLFDAKFDTKVEKLIDVIEDNDLTIDQLNKIKKIVLDKIKGNA